MTFFLFLVSVSRHARIQTMNFCLRMPHFAVISWNYDKWKKKKKKKSKKLINMND